MIKTVTSIISKNRTYQYFDNGEPIVGSLKDVYFSPDKTFVVAIYRTIQEYSTTVKLKKIVTQYHDNILHKDGGAYYKDLYCWPIDVIEDGKRIGLIIPCFKDNFLFKKGYANNNLLIGKEKQGKWFASAKFRVANCSVKLDDSELGNWLSYIQISVHISRGVKRLHAAGLAHSDLSYKNVLIDPVTKTAAIIDIDGLVVPNLFPPDVIGTTDFIAPEVLRTSHLNRTDPNRKLPNRLTDLHALAVLIYMYLFYRHPLRGGNYFGQMETEEEEYLLMGEKALFIEHPTDKRNTDLKREYGDDVLEFSPWTDLNKTPYTIAGPYLKELFELAFIKGLHNPIDRPLAITWEEALIKTDDLKLQCSNPKCEQKWFIYTDTNHTFCPFCQTKYNNSIPVLYFHYQYKIRCWKSEKQRLVIYNGCTLHLWHSNRNTLRNEILTNEQKVRVGYFALHNDKWVLVNERLPTLKDLTENKEIPIGSMVYLTNGKSLLLSKDDGGRAAIISITRKI